MKESWEEDEDEYEDFIEEEFPNYAESKEKHHSQHTPSASNGAGGKMNKGRRKDEARHLKVTT